MFIAMNRFKIVKQRQKDFENIWRKRDTHLDDVVGFLEFHLVRGLEQENFILYASYSKWRTKEDFYNWTKSEEFRKAHKNVGQHSNIYLGHPEFEGFDVVL